MIDQSTVAASYVDAQTTMLAHHLAFGHETTMRRHTGPGSDGLWIPLCAQGCDLTY